MPDGSIARPDGTDHLPGGRAAATTGAVPAAEPAPTADRRWSSPGVAAQVAEFHRTYGLPVRSTPTADVGAAEAALRLDLLEEEVGELRAAVLADDLIGIADALADAVYIAYGTAHAYGIDLDAVLDEVHRSNMTKLAADGRPVRRADGKILKGPHYRPPDVAAVLAATLPAATVPATTLPAATLPAATVPAATLT